VYHDAIQLHRIVVYEQSALIAVPVSGAKIEKSPFRAVKLDKQKCMGLARAQF
jgi:hypothetical protein